MTPLRVARALFLAVALPAAAAAQTGWTLRSPSFARVDVAMAYDNARERTVLFGGRGIGQLLGDTWEWDGVMWRQRQPNASPPARSDAAMVYDSQRGVMVLFGGHGGRHYDDTWEYDGTTWTLRQVALRPPARYEHVMAYDRIRGRTVLFGGYDGSGFTYHDTWEWDGTRWQQLLPDTWPAVRYGSSMAYDEARAETVLFSYRRQTWSWDGTDWRLHGVGGPSMRIDAAMVYDAARRRIVLFGGGSTQYYADTWEWDGSTWLVRDTAGSPSARTWHAMAYDAARGKVVLVGGGTCGRFSCSVAGETWEYAATTPAGYTRFGTACPGSAGAPALVATAGGLPWVGGSFGLDLGPVPAATGSALLLIGRSKGQWGATQLPLDLAAAGMPGCSLLASPDVVLPAAVAGGRASWTLALCSCPTLIGASLFVQGVVPDPAANAAGAVTSNAGHLRLGGL